MTTATKTVATIADLRAGAQEAYRNAVVDLVDGAGVDPGELATVLFQSGKTYEDLERDVNLLLQRRRLSELFATRPVAQQGLDQATAELADLVDQRARFLARIDVQIAGARAVVETSSRAVGRANEATVRLRDTAPIELREKVQLLAVEEDRLAKERRAIRERVTNLNEAANVALPRRLESWWEASTSPIVTAERKAMAMAWEEEERKKKWAADQLAIEANRCWCRKAPIVMAGACEPGSPA
jgi:hypothetical protein